MRVEEGGFKKGKKDGYCRVLKADTGNCEVGFFKEDQPMGKYCEYKLDGTYEQPEGLYEGEKNCKTKIEIANYMQKISQTQGEIAEKKRKELKTKKRGMGTLAAEMEDFDSAGDD